MKKGKRREVEEKPKPRVLLIDDDENIRKTLTEILRERGYIVDSADTGERAIELSNKRFYNIALVDIRLPDISGVDLLTKLKKTKPRMRKIIITGYPTLENAIEALNRGADAYIVKPLDISRALRTIEEQLEEQRKEQKMTEEQLVEYIETRAKQLQQEE